MENQLVRPNHTYNGGDRTINKDMPNHHLNNVFSIVIHLISINILLLSVHDTSFDLSLTVRL